MIPKRYQIQRNNYVYGEGLFENDMNNQSENALHKSKADLIMEIKAIHSTFRLSGNSKTDLLSVSDDQLLYLLSILKNEPYIKAPVLDNEEWENFIGFLNWHFITPFIYRSLNKMPMESRPPPELFEKMKTVYLKGVSRSIKMEKLLKTLLDNANKDNTKIFVLKGPAIARTLYADPSLRYSTDIDLLVSPEDVLRLREIVENMGYICLEKRFEHYEKGYCEEVFRPKSDNQFNIQVEVHWKLYPFDHLNQFIKTNSLFKRAIRVESNGVSFETLDYIDSLIFAAMHMIYDHNGSIQLNWIIDISLLCKKLSSNEDWLELQKRSVDQGARLAIEKALIMAQLWTDFKIPDGFDDFSKWPTPSKEEIRNFKYAIHHGTLDIFKLIFPDNASLMEKMRVLYRLIFPAPALMGVNSTSKMWHLPILYCKRWYQLLKEIK